MSKVTFSIEGEFVTDLARSWFWDEDKPYETCEKLLISCLSGTEQTEDELKRIAQEIIEGKKKLVGVNELTLEDDNENVRPISLKLYEQFRQIKIQEMKNFMDCRMINFVDPYSVRKSIEDAKQHGVTSYAQCMTWFWYKENAIDINYMRPYEPGDGMLIDEHDDTDIGLWLYYYPDIAYDAYFESNEMPENEYDSAFWSAVYALIKDDHRFQSKFFKERNENYLACSRMKQNKESVKTKTVFFRRKDEPISDECQRNLKYCEDFLNTHEKPDEYADDSAIRKHATMSIIYHVLSDNESPLSTDKQIYYILPDNYEKWEGIIAPNGDFYSCSFGGHNVKAYHIMLAYPEKFPNIDYSELSIDCANALDTILEQGWCATRRSPITGNYVDPPKMNEGRYTSAQKSAIFDAKIKHNVSVDLSGIDFE